MDFIHKLLIVDETLGAKDLINEIINDEGNYSISFADAKIQAEEAVAKRRPDLILLNGDSKVCLGIANALMKIKECPPFVVMGKTVEETENKKALKKLKPIYEIKLPFDMDDFCEKTEEACFLSEGMIDEITGLYKKPCFDFKVNRLLKKKTEGVFFCISLNAYSFAANPSNPLQIQMSVFALKNELSDAILGINGNVILGFIPSEEEQQKIEARLNKLIETMRSAAEGPEIFTPAGAAQSGNFGYSLEDLFLYADRAMELSKNEGKNLVKFYR